MKLMQIITFTSVRLYCLITLICLIILISHILQLFLIQKFIVSVQVRIFPLNTCDLMIYIARWWEKYLSKRGIIKHTCSRRNKLIVLWTLNRQMKIFLRIRVNNAFNNLLWKVFNKLFNDIQKFIVFALWFFTYWCLRFLEFLEAQKLWFSIFPGLKVLNKTKKSWKPFKTFWACKSIKQFQ